MLTTPRFGLRCGVVARDFSPEIPLDSKSGKGVPLTQAEWNSTFLLASKILGSAITPRTVANSHALDDASGNPAARVGTAWTVNGTVDYQIDKSADGWNRRAVRISETTSERLGHAAGVGVNPATGSVLRFGYVDLALPAAAAGFMVISAGAVSFIAQMRATTGFLRVQINAVTSADGTVDHAALGVFPAVLQYNKAAGRAALYTEREKIVGTYNAGVVDGVKGWGTVTPPQTDVLWDSDFGGTNAELTEFEIKAVLRALGWNPIWTPA